MKDYIDRSFMKIFDPNYLFNDYKTKGTAEPIENNELFEEENKEDKVLLAKARELVSSMEPRRAAQMLLDVETGPEDGFMERWMIIDLSLIHI